MTTHVKGTTSRCNRLLELPPVLTEWQQKAYCPDCDHYCDGQCCDPIDSSGNAACPFDGKALPLREVTVETPDDQPGGRSTSGPGEAQESQPRFKALEQAIKLRIVDRTGGRIRALVVN